MKIIPFRPQMLRHCTADECMIKILRQKAITAFFCEKYGDHVQHNQCTSSESVNLTASTEPVDLDEDYSIQTADAEPTLAKGQKLINPFPATDAYNYTS